MVPGNPTAAPVNVTYEGSTAIDTDTTNYTFSAHNWGAEAADRIIVVCVSSRAAGNNPITSVTVGGNATAAPVNFRNSSGGNSTNSGIFWVALPTGTSGDIVVNHGSGALRCAISVYNMTGSDGSQPASGTGSSSAADPTANINCAEGGAIIGTAYTQASATATWTGITEDVETTMDATNRHSSAHLEFSAAQTGLTVTCDWSTGTLTGGAFCAFNPLS